MVIKITMKISMIFFILLIFLSACTPVFVPEIMKQASIDPPFENMISSSGKYQGRLFLLGGTIIDVKLLEEGSLLEVAYTPVDSRGYLSGRKGPDRRFLALLHREKGILDPLIYKKEREITVAGIFIENRKGAIQQMPYVFPLFEIRGIYLWPERTEYYLRSYPYWYDPWYDSWDYPFGYRPWWRYHPYRYWR
ncbi:MAG: Slp family lipoprotein [Dissulfurispiraceae bacterium]|jgi:outer membrane lipoprotein|nr:Slp family lipoprotein [Dissulfurispiraceae bacterium]